MKIYCTVSLAILLSASLFFEEMVAQRGRRRRNRRRRIRPIIPTDPVVPVVPPVSAPINCGPIPHVVNGQGLETGDSVNYACQPGYRLEGTNVITCVDGRWTVAPRCIRELCMSPPNIAFANPPQLTNSGTRATYTCISGYTIQGSGGQTSRTADCNVNSQSWPTLPLCEAISTIQVCQAPPVIDNASRQISGNAVAIYTCDAGYIKVAGTPSVLTCSGTSWIGGTPACTRNPSVAELPTRCTRAPPCGGTNVNRPANVADSYTPGSKITYTCSTGYRIAGQNDNKKNSEDVECKNDGTWTSVPTCEPVICGAPPPGTFTNTVVTSAVIFGSTYKYTCINLYEISSDVTVVCQADGTWSQGAPTCTRKVCKFSAIPTVTNGKPQITANTDTQVGTNVTVVCNTDHRVAPPISGSTANTIQNIFCQENGTFTTPRSCVYQYPTSCKDHFQRDNRIPATGSTVVPTESVKIDTDGPGLAAAPTTVSCSVNAARQVCTSIAPISGASLGTEPLPCQNGGKLGPTTIPAASSTASGSGICGTSTVNYPLSEAQIKSVLSSSTSCQQQVKSTCAGATRLFFALLRNGDTHATAYAQVITAFTSGIKTNWAAMLGDTGACDCYYTAAEGSECSRRGCFCSNDAAVSSGSDTVTLPLTPNALDYVTQFAIVTAVEGKNPASGIAPGSLSPNTMVLNIGNIECCESV